MKTAFGLLLFFLTCTLTISHGYAQQDLKERYRLCAMYGLWSESTSSELKLSSKAKTFISRHVLSLGHSVKSRDLMYFQKECSQESYRSGVARAVAELNQEIEALDCEGESCGPSSKSRVIADLSEINERLLKEVEGRLASELSEIKDLIRSSRGDSDQLKKLEKRIQELETEKAEMSDRIKNLQNGAGAAAPDTDFSDRDKLAKTQEVADAIYGITATFISPNSGHAVHKMLVHISQAFAANQCKLEWEMTFTESLIYLSDGREESLLSPLTTKDLLDLSNVIQVSKKAEEKQGQKHYPPAVVLVLRGNARQTHEIYMPKEKLNGVLKKFEEAVRACKP